MSEVKRASGDDRPLVVVPVEVWIRHSAVGSPIFRPKLTESFRHPFPVNSLFWGKCTRH